MSPARRGPVPPLRRSLLVVVTVAALALLVVAPSAGGGALAGEQDRAGPDLAETARAASQWEGPRARTSRAGTPEDRYELAGGCYRLASVAAGAPLVRTAGGYRPDAGSDDPEAFRLRATDLGRYLLLDRREHLLAAEDGAVGTLLDEATDNSAAAAADGVSRGELGGALDEAATGEAGTATGRGGAVVAAEEPSGLADFDVVEDGGAFRLVLAEPGLALAVNDDGELTLVDAAAAGRAGRWRFHLDDDCAEWPEPQLNVTGEHPTGQTPFEEVAGHLDAHLHLMASEFLGGRARCGQPWHPYGVARALQGCDEHEDSGGRTHVLETGLSGGVNPVEGHDTTGWPTFVDWPRHDLLTYEQVHHRWLERAHRGGLRLITALLVDNNVLCEVYPFKENSCNEMDGVRLQARRMHELVDFIDAQHGGPGQGWMRIVTDPFEARRVINDGRLAVVLGMEVSRPFDCRLLLGVPQCSREDLDRELAALHDLGVRQLELVNKFDNALTGVAGDAGETGVIVNHGNVVETGRYWQMEPCDADDQDHGHGDHHGEAHDKRQMNLHDEAGTPEEATGRDSLVGGLLEVTGASGVAPLYPAGPHCNVRGLSDLGEHVLRGIMDRGMIFDPDHMSARARHQALDLVEEEGYSGVVSSHSWADDIVYQRVYELGGVVTPMAGSSTGFARVWEQHREWADERFTFGFGYGSDVNGFATQGAPRFPGADPDDPPDGAVAYPFEGFGGVEIDRQVSGERVFDVNTEGVAHYGLYPDWLEDLRLLAGDRIVEDMERGSEAYLQMWERAVGIAPDACRHDVDGLDPQRLEQLEPGSAPEEVLLALGQPTARAGSTFTYCLDPGQATVHFDADHRLDRVEVEDPGQAPGPPSDRPGHGPPDGAGGPGGHGGHGHAHVHGHVHGADGEATPAASTASAVDAGGAPPAWALLVVGLLGLAVHALRRRGSRP